MTFGHSVPVADLFGTSGRELLAGFELPEPWATTLATSLTMLDELDERIDGGHQSRKPPRAPAGGTPDAAPDGVADVVIVLLLEPRSADRLAQELVATRRPSSADAPKGA